MKKCVFQFMILLLVFFSVCGCQLSRESQKNKDNVTQESIEYVEKKYNKNFEVSKSGYVMTNSTLFPTYSDDIMIEFTDGTKVMYFSKEEEFYDNYQEKLITKTLEKEIWEPMLENLKPYYFEETSYNIIPAFNLFNVEGYEGSYFHEYYDGDIKNFIKKEKLSVDVGYFNEYNHWEPSQIYILSEDANSWQGRFELVDKTLDKYFKGQLKYNGIQLVAITPELYDSLLKEGKHNVDVGMVGCWATGNNKRLEVQNYIKVSEGIYATSAEANFVLQEGDIKLKEVMTSNELQTIIDKVAKEKQEKDEFYNKYEKYKYKVNSLTPIYEFEYSDRVKNRYKGNTTAQMHIYIKIVPSELNISSDNNLYVYPYYNHYNKKQYYESFKVSEGNSINGNLEFVYPNTEVNKEYFWIGTQIREELVKEENIE